MESLPAWLKPHPEGTCISVKAQTRSPRDEVAGAVGSELKIKVTAPPVDAAANEALIRFLSQILDCPKSAVVLLRGGTARHKLLLIRGMAPADVAAKIQQAQV